MSRRFLICTLVATLGTILLTPEASAEVVGATGRFLRVIKTDGSVNPGDANRFHIGEVEAFAFGVPFGSGLDNSKDLALATVGAAGATVSGVPHHGADSALVNGVVDGGSATWSRRDPLPIIAQVDLGSTRSLSSFRVWQRADGCCDDRLQSFDVQLLADDGAGNPGAVVFSQNHPGQVPSGSFSQFDLPNTDVNPGTVGSIGNDVVASMPQNLTTGPVVVPGAARIRLEQNLDDTFQIAEIRAFEDGTGTNVALQANGGMASASSSGFGTTPAIVNDGDLTQSYPSVWHSAGGDQEGAFVEVAFSSPKTLDSVHIFGRHPCCPGRQDNFDLILFDNGGAEIHRQTVLGLGTDPAIPSGDANRRFDLSAFTGGEDISILGSTTLTLEIDAATLTADSLTVFNSDPALDTILDVTDSVIQFDLIDGNPRDLDGEVFQVLDADQIVGTPSDIIPLSDLRAVEMDTSQLLIDGTVSFTLVPEPASLGLWSLVAVALLCYGYRRVRRASPSR